MLRIASEDSGADRHLPLASRCHELEKQRYISLLTAVVFHRAQPTSDAMRAELTKECAPRPKVTPK